MDIRNPLFHAAVRGDAQAILASASEADARAPLDLEEDYGVFFADLTLLMVAAGSPWSDVATLEALMNCGSVLDQRSLGGVSAAWYAVSGIPGAFLDKGINRDEEGRWYTDGRGDVARLTLLLDLGADPNECAPNGRCLVGEACSNGNPKCLELLLSRGAETMPRLMENIFGEPGPALRNWFVDIGAGQSAKKTGLGWPEIPEEWLTSMRGNSEWPEAPEGLQTSMSAWISPLHLAAESGSLECVRLLLDAGVPADLRDDSGASALAKAATPEIAALLVERGAAISASGGTYGDVIDSLFEDKHYEAAKALLKAGAPLESSAWGPTRAHGLTCVHMDLEALKIFMECGGDIHTPSYEGGTILHTACWQGEYSEDSDPPPAAVRAMIEFLIAQGIPLDVVDKHGNTALHEAVGGDWELPTAVDVLLEHGANPNVQNHAGTTPLMIAATCCERCVRSLLKHGADPRLKDASAKTALDHALNALMFKTSEAEVTRCVEMLQEAMAR